MIGTTAALPSLSLEEELTLKVLWSRRVLSFALMMFFVSACSPLSDPPSADHLRDLPHSEVRIVEVIDGDTISVRFGTGQVESVRLLGIDTPETVDPTRPVQCFGHEASEELVRLLPIGTSITLERDHEARDRFGRLLSYVYRASDGLFVNEALLANGFADLSIYEPNSTYRIELTSAATAARTGAKGLWGACGGADVPLDPPDYQTQAKPVQ